MRRLQRAMVERIEADGVNAFIEALRRLTAHHRVVVESLASTSGALKLFVPVGSPAAFDQIIRRAVLISDCTVFTNLPASRSRLTSGEPVSSVTLWDFPGCRYGSFIHAETVDVIRRHAIFFTEGRAFFYPAPTLIEVTRENADEVAPGLAKAFEVRPDLAAWTECAPFEYALSAENIGALHTLTVDAEALTGLGKAFALLDIPYIANVAPDDLHRIMEDNQESLTSFRARTRTVLDDLVNSGSDIESGIIRKRFVRDLWQLKEVHDTT